MLLSKPLANHPVTLKGKIKSVRPGYGLHPKHFDEVSYYYATQDLEVGDRLAWDVISKEKN